MRHHGASDSRHTGKQPGSHKGWGGVAAAIKHFPGGRARENGFDPHYVQGQWNVYQTEDSLRTYHLPAFRTAIDKKASSIMPYYAKPSAAKSKSQYGPDGDAMEMEPVGFAFNRVFIQGLLREKMGFEGYVNSDSGISNKMAWGVEELDVPSRIALAVNTGVDIISGSLDVFSAREAYERGRNGYYTTQGHPVPRGYRASDLVLTDEALTRAVTRTLKEKFELGMFDNPYRDPEEAEQVVATKKHWEDAYRVHQQSVVLLKNREGLIPLDAEKTAGRKVYVECFGCEAEAAAKETEAVKRSFAERFQAELTEDYREADFAILFIRPSSGEYFHSTKGYLELDICENKQVRDVDSEGNYYELDFGLTLE